MRSKYFGSLALALILVLCWIFFINRPAPPGATSETPTVVQQAPSRSSSLPDVLQRTIQRTYAIDILFHKVYNAEWEGAYGAIGDAYLYAATGDPALLSLYTDTYRLLDMKNGTWVDDRAWVCLAEMTWWKFSGGNNKQWIDDARTRYLEARNEGRLSHHEGYWSWYNYSPGAKGNFRIFTNSNMNQMAAVACRLYEATHDRRFYNDALLIWNGDAKYPGVEKKFYRGNGIWKGDEGKAAFGKQFPWEGAGMCAIGAALFRMTGEKKYKEIAVATAQRIMDPANGWVDPKDFYQIRMDGNGAFVHFILDAYHIAPDRLSDIPVKIEKMLEHVWTNHHGTALTTLHRPVDDGIRNGWNPNGGEDGYNVNEVGTVHAQAEAVRAFGVFAYVLHEMKEQNRK
ncbi:MAG: hypothetical protein EHM64_07700 [Ignavibacteriae bacterium]|nr:MAG: hypothetical protein EHM64_07700 [Ignavibacteriota bacterium]